MTTKPPSRIGAGSRRSFDQADRAVSLELFEPHSTVSKMFQGD